MNNDPQHIPRNINLRNRQFRPFKSLAQIYEELLNGTGKQNTNSIICEFSKYVPKDSSVSPLAPYSKAKSGTNDFYTYFCVKDYSLSGCVRWLKVETIRHHLLYLLFTSFTQLEAQEQTISEDFPISSFHTAK